MNEHTIRSQYNKLANIYDKRWHHYHSNSLSFLKNWVNISAQSTVFDVACGTGIFAEMLLQDQPNLQIIGVDISSEMLKIAKEKCQNYSNVEFHQFSVTSLPFENNNFDYVICANAFHYFDDPITALKEMKRLVKPDGQIIILDWCRDYLTMKICDLILTLFDASHKNCYTQTELSQFLASTELQIIDNTKFSFSWVWGLMIFTASPNFS
ncbi:hypothetical protein cce_2151 [Crocosphaera subtropica ATCC 51142]|uniref:Methyltransferase type 11 domain-containing protein n=1 Tax=Crocosphaera subtropica (strain ATCC 51142 / BH68) TaxID=43989 RepID=B1WNS2_CROS5|nr:class I SAM-dependent methyltransferase [Crocosphaera subtropica]ACB51501.1 hypothetical protein cce_2151 [Crocosphaera subtropica ATCC 51142]